MDRKSITILALSFVLLMLWPALIKKLYPPLPVAESATVIAGAAGEPLPRTNEAIPVLRNQSIQCRPRGQSADGVCGAFGRARTALGGDQ